MYAPESEKSRPPVREEPVKRELHDILGPRHLPPMVISVEESEAPAREKSL
jgi:hypothetical protein